MKRYLKSLKTRKYFILNRAIFSRFVNLFYSNKSNYQISKIVVDGFDIDYRLNSTDMAVINHSFTNDIYVNFLKDRLNLNEVKNIIDIGAHIGCSSLGISKLIHNDHKIIAIEASKDTFDLLKSNVNNNRLNSIYPIHKAVTNKVDKVKLYKHLSGDWGNNLYTKSFFQYEYTESIDLNTIIDYYFKGDVDLIKINAEGSEFDIISSISVLTFERIRNFIILYHLDLSPNFHLSQITEPLLLNGFDYVIENENIIRGWIYAFKN